MLVGHHHYLVSYRYACFVNLHAFASAAVGITLHPIHTFLLGLHLHLRTLLHLRPLRHVEPFELPSFIKLPSQLLQHLVVHHIRPFHLQVGTLLPLTVVVIINVVIKPKQACAIAFPFKPAHLLPHPLLPFDHHHHLAFHPHPLFIALPDRQYRFVGTIADLPHLHLVLRRQRRPFPCGLLAHQQSLAPDFLHHIHLGFPHHSHLDHHLQHLGHHPGPHLIPLQFLLDIDPFTIEELTAVVERTVVATAQHPFPFLLLHRPFLLANRSVPRLHQHAHSAQLVDIIAVQPT